MSTATLGPLAPRTRRFTRQEYYRLAELGMFQDQRVELIEGEILEMPVPGNAHCVANECSAEVLRNLFGKRFWVRVQMPLNLSPLSDVIPDVAVVPGTPRDYIDHPTSALLVLEVSDTTLLFDRLRKGSLCARVGIADFWIVNVVNRQLEVYRQPIVDSEQPYGYRYQEVLVLKKAKDAIAPLALPRKKVQVATLLP